MTRGMPAAANAASAAARARSRARDRDERRSDRSKQWGGMALRRVPIVKGGSAVGWRSAGSPVRGLGLVLVLLAEKEEDREGFFSSSSSRVDGCERALSDDDAPSSTADAMTLAAAARPLRLGTL